jgi:hypothetical protein
LKPLLVALLTLTGAAQATSAELDADALIARWVELWNTYDLHLVDELFLTDSRVTYFSSEREGLIRGIEAVREHHRGFGFVEGGRAPEQELWVEQVEADDFGGTAVITAIWYFGDRGTPEQAQRGPMTFVYVRVGEEYRLAHLHFANYE